jgi:hypothetical protein
VGLVLAVRPVPQAAPVVVHLVTFTLGVATIAV